MQYRPPNAHQEISNTNHVGSVSDSLGRLASASECMASDIHTDLWRIMIPTAPPSDNV